MVCKANIHTSTKGSSIEQLCNPYLDKLHFTRKEEVICKTNWQMSLLPQKFLFRIAGRKILPACSQ